MNKIIPNFKPMVTGEVWYPWKVLSRKISRHQVYIVIKIIVDPIKNVIGGFIWNNLVIPDNIIIIPKALVRGQGLKFTKW